MNAGAFSHGAFAAALLASDAPPPGLAGAAASGRFRVYRNNVLGGLARALAERFPVVHRLVGEAFFMAMASEFARLHPPASPLMLQYGARFPGFLAGFPPVADLPYLPDVARLELLCGRAYHAAEMPSLPPQAFAGLDPAAIAELGFELHPSLSVLRSIHPVVSIWRANRGAGAPGPLRSWQGEEARIWRDDAAVVVDLLRPGEAAFLALLQAGLPLGSAIAAATSEVPAFDHIQALAELIGPGLVVALRHPDHIDPTRATETGP
jgi:hypothetical protein